MQLAVLPTDLFARAALEACAGDATIAPEDVTQFVMNQRRHASAPYSELRTPSERVLVPALPGAALAVGLGSP